MHILKTKSCLSEVLDAGGILERHLEDKDAVYELLGNHNMAEGPMLVMPIDGQGSGSVYEQGDYFFYFYCEALSFVKITKILFL